MSNYWVKLEAYNLDVDREMVCLDCRIVPLYDARQMRETMWKARQDGAFVATADIIVPVSAGKNSLSTQIAQSAMEQAQELHVLLSFLFSRDIKPHRWEVYRDTGLSELVEPRGCHLHTGVVPWGSPLIFPPSDLPKLLPVMLTHFKEINSCNHMHIWNAMEALRVGRSVKCPQIRFLATFWALEILFNGHANVVHGTSRLPKVILKELKCGLVQVIQRWAEQHKEYATAANSVGDSLGELNRTSTRERIKRLLEDADRPDVCDADVKGFVEARNDITHARQLWPDMDLDLSWACQQLDTVTQLCILRLLGFCSPDACWREGRMGAGLEDIGVLPSYSKEAE